MKNKLTAMTNPMRMELACLATFAMAMTAAHLTAQVFTTLHSFTAIPYRTETNSDGARPDSLILSGNTLYGTATAGGSSGNGTVFAVNTNGTGFTNLYSFTGGGDGAIPGGLLLSGNTLYGAAAAGGSSGNGTVFAVNTNGTGFTTLYSFTANPYGTNSDGAYPDAGLILSGNTLYGTASEGGSSGSGTVFALNTDGTGFTTLYSFTGGNDGSGPGGLILSGNTLYGATHGGGSMSGTTGNWESGTVFAVKTDGTDFTTLNYFPAVGAIVGIIYGSEGGNPRGLILSGNTLYGMADTGTSNGGG